MFLGTARTSKISRVRHEHGLPTFRIDELFPLTPLRHLHEKQLLALLRLGDVCGNERVLYDISQVS